MKALIVPDVHMKFEGMIDTIHDLWRQHRPDKLVLLGDYFDDWVRRVTTFSIGEPATC